MPKPNSVVNFHNSYQNQSVKRQIQMTETGDADLTITTAKIVGEYATDFEVISPATPFTIVNGESDEIMILTCTPSDLGVRTATLKLSTNDPTFSEVEYTLKCTGIKENTNDSSVSPTPSAPVSPSEDNIVVPHGDDNSSTEIVGNVDTGEITPTSDDAPANTTDTVVVSDPPANPDTSPTSDPDSSPTADPDTSPTPDPDTTPDITPTPVAGYTSTPAIDSQIDFGEIEKGNSVIQEIQIRNVHQII
jgi:hypothetical protein